jgi:hypothetical protein
MATIIKFCENFVTEICGMPYQLYIFDLMAHEGACEFMP